MIEEAIKLIESYGDDFDTILSEYFLNGYVWSSPNDFCLAKYNPETKDLFVYLAIGNIYELMWRVGFQPQTISFRRGMDKKVKSYDYQRFIAKVKKI